MMMRIYALRDEKTDHMESVFVTHNNQTAMREAARMFTYSDNYLKFGKDYDLFLIGQFHTHSGAITPMDREFVCSGLDLLKILAEAEKAHREQVHDSSEQADGAPSHSPVLQGSPS